jgi:DNA-binding response OmpR family regulator
MREQALGTILCVADDEADRHALARIFREAGFEVQEAATGGEALTLAQQQPALVLLAVNRPAGNGFEVCRQIKAQASTAAIPLLFLLGADATPAEKIRAREEGAAGYLTRPVAPSELLARTTALLRPQPAGPPAGTVEGQPVPASSCRSGLTKTDAEKLLDWLEANGYPHRELSYKEGEGFRVRWQGGPAREPPGGAGP